MCKISVIIPIWNSSSVISETIESIQCGIYKNIEIICVNDGSTDSTLEVLASLSKKYNNIKIVSIKNQGPGPARNIGLMNATGEYVSFIDSDDIVDCEFYEKLYKVACKSKADIVAGKLVYQPSSSEREQDLEKYYANVNIDSRFFYRTFTTAIYKRSLLEKNKILFPNYRMGEDCIFAFKAACKASKIEIINDVTYYYRKTINKNSITRTQYVDSECLNSKFELIKLFNAENLRQDIYSYEVSRIVISFFNSLWSKNLGFYNRYCVVKKLVQLNKIIKSDAQYDFRIKNEAPILYKYFQIDNFNLLSFIRCPVSNLNKLFLNTIRNSSGPIVFYGASNFLIQFLNKHKNKLDINNFFIVDSSNKIKSVNGIQILAKDSLKYIKFNTIIICVIHHQNEIKRNIENLLVTYNLPHISVVDWLNK
ncbi:MAG: glycosyltransferase family 2 protein [Succinivibrio sp.]|nr:glycosyltransferase family 2 protein [Succinivibrio sp.]